MNKTWTIEGSKNLKEAFIKELNLKPEYSKESALNWSYIGNEDCSDENVYQGVSTKQDNHFKLPEQWGEAKEFIINININSLEENEYYYVEEDDFWMIGKVSKGNNGNNDDSTLRGDCYYMISQDKEYIKEDSWCYSDKNRTFRKATPDEIEWLELCHKAGKFLTKEQIKKYNKYSKLYVRYNESITEEDFNKLLEFAKEKMVIGKPYDYYPNNDFQEFKNGGYFWLHCRDDFYSYGVDNNSQGCTETTLEELGIKTKDFKVGDWVKIDNLHGEKTTHKHCGEIGAIFKVGEIKNGIWYYGNWGIQNKIEGYCWKKHNLVFATEDEIKNHLIKEAKKRGFVEGFELSRISRIKRSNEGIVDSNPPYLGAISSKYKYVKELDVLKNMGAVLYCDGYWSEVREEIREKPKKVAVHVTTQDEWDFVIDKLKTSYYNDFDLYRTETAIDLSDSSYCNIKWFKKNDYKIISFGEWCKDNNYTFIKPNILKFGDVEFLIDGSRATTVYGTVTKEEVDKAIEYLENPPSLACYKLTIHVNNTYINLYENNFEFKIGFGCKSGTLEELKQIQKAFKLI